MSATPDEIAGAMLIRDRSRSRQAIASLVRKCVSTNGDFLLSDGSELASASEAMAYLFDHPTVEALLCWSCGRDYLALDFLDDGSLMVLWLWFDLTVEEAVAAIDAMAERLAPERGYVSAGPWLPCSPEEFSMGFDGETLYRFVREPS